MTLGDWICVGIGIAVGVVLTRLWLALDLDAKRPWKKRDRWRGI